MVRNCIKEGWVTEKECKTCYYKNMERLDIIHKDCISDNVIEEERNDIEE